MKSFYAPLLFLATLFQFASCKKDPVVIIDFSKYTATDSNCLITGAVDNTDWTDDITWAAQENALLAFSDNIVLVDSIEGYIDISPLCPNPGDGLFTMDILTERECKMKIACVNTEMETLYFIAKKLTGGPPVTTEFDLRALTSFHKNMNYRMYYAFYTADDSVYYKGHGDFRIE